MKMNGTTRLKIGDINKNLICVLCGGYFIDATTIIECLHSFCRTCIVTFLKTSRTCPVCDTIVHKTRPHQNIRSDKLLQDLVYKLVPGLYKDEMRRRREFYTTHYDAAPKRAGEERGDEMSDRFAFTEEENISLALHFCPDGGGDRLDFRRVFTTKEDLKSRFDRRIKESIDVRYLQCKAAVTIRLLKKFIRLKFSLPAHYQVDMFYNDEPMRNSYTLCDVAYIFNWRRRAPLQLTYCVYEGVEPKKQTVLSETTNQAVVTKPLTDDDVKVKSETTETFGEITSAKRLTSTCPRSDDVNEKKPPLNLLKKTPNKTSKSKQPPTASAKPLTAAAKPPTAPAKPPTAPSKPPTAAAKPPTAPSKQPTAAAKPPKVADSKTETAPSSSELSASQTPLHEQTSTSIPQAGVYDNDPKKLDSKKIDSKKGAAGVTMSLKRTKNTPSHSTASKKPKLSVKDDVKNSLSNPPQQPPNFLQIPTSSNLIASATSNRGAQREPVAPSSSSLAAPERTALSSQEEAAAIQQSAKSFSELQISQSRNMCSDIPQKPTVFFDKIQGKYPQIVQPKTSSNFSQPKSAPESTQFKHSTGIAQSKKTSHYSQPKHSSEMSQYKFSTDVTQNRNAISVPQNKSVPTASQIKITSTISQNNSTSTISHGKIAPDSFNTKSESPKNTIDFFKTTIDTSENRKTTCIPQLHYTESGPQSSKHVLRQDHSATPPPVVTQLQNAAVNMKQSSRMLSECPQQKQAVVSGLVQALLSGAYKSPHILTPQQATMPPDGSPSSSTGAVPEPKKSRKRGETSTKRRLTAPEAVVQKKQPQPQPTVEAPLTTSTNKPPPRGGKQKKAETFRVSTEILNNKNTLLGKRPPSSPYSVAQAPPKVQVLNKDNNEVSKYIKVDQNGQGLVSLNKVPPNFLSVGQFCGPQTPKEEMCKLRPSVRTTAPSVPATVSFSVSSLLSSGPMKHDNAVSVTRNNKPMSLGALTTTTSTTTSPTTTRAVSATSSVKTALVHSSSPVASSHQTTASISKQGNHPKLPVAANRSNLHSCHPPSSLHSFTPAITNDSMANPAPSNAIASPTPATSASPTPAAVPVQQSQTQGSDAAQTATSTTPVALSETRDTKREKTAVCNPTAQGNSALTKQESTSNKNAEEVAKLLNSSKDYQNQTFVVIPRTNGNTIHSVQVSSTTTHDAHPKTPLPSLPTIDCPSPASSSASTSPELNGSLRHPALSPTSSSMGTTSSSARKQVAQKKKIADIANTLLLNQNSKTPAQSNPRRPVQPSSPGPRHPHLQDLSGVTGRQEQALKQALQNVPPQGADRGVARDKAGTGERAVSATNPESDEPLNLVKRDKEGVRLTHGMFILDIPPSIK